MNKTVKVLFFSALIFSFLLTADKKSETPVWEMTDTLKMTSGGSVISDVKIIVPKGYDLVVGTSNGSLNTIADFRTNPTSGLQIEPDKRPAGKKKGNLTLASGNANFKLKISDLKGKENGSQFTADIVFNYQLCESSGSGKCLSPATLKKDITIQIDKDKQVTKLTPAKRGSSVNWINSYDTALEKAKTTDQNVYVIVTAPTWCGACKYMERESFAKAPVQKVLNENFIPLQVLDTSSDMDKFDIQGFPTSFILNSKGEILSTQVGGMAEGGLLSFLKSYKKSAQTPETKDIPTPPAKPDGPDMPVPPAKPDAPQKNVLSWKKEANVAHYKGANWSGFLGTIKYGSEETCKEACKNAPDCHFFFFNARGNLVLEPTDGNLFWRYFDSGECAFFKGKPWFGSANQSDSFIKMIDGKELYEK